MLGLTFLAAAVAARLIPGSLVITGDDYPIAARRAGEQGIVVARLLVDASGYVADCSIAKSSGSVELDAATCTLVRQRARYEPALDAAGLPVASTHDVPIRWLLEDSEEALVSKGYRIFYTIDAAGQVGPCRVEQFGPPDPDFQCDPTLAPTLATAYLKRPLAAYRELTLTMATRLEPEAGFAAQPGAELAVVAAATVMVAPDGRVVACSQTAALPFKGQTMNFCDDLPAGKKAFVADAAGKPHSVRISLEVAALPR